jgi:hypothetical protein
MNIEGVEMAEDKQEPTQKPSWNHVEEASTDKKAAIEPYWDTPYVIGATRNLSSDEYSPSQEKAPRKPGFWKRLWLHYKRYWILYAIAGVIFLAVFLPVL